VRVVEPASISDPDKAAVSHASSQQLRRRALWLEYATLAWNVVGSAVVLTAAVSARSVALAGFGLDSLIEILASLVVQGLSFPALLKLVGLEDEGRTEKEENKARIYATEAALARLEDLADEDWVRDDTLNRVRAMFNFRNQRFRSRFDPESDGEIENRSLDYQRLLRELLAAERNAVFDLRRERRIDDVVMRRVIRDLDLEEARLDG